MKTLTIILFFIPLWIFSQAPKISVKSQYDISFIKKSKQLILKEDKDFVHELPVMKVNGEYYVSFVGKLRNISTTNLTSSFYFIGNGVGEIRSLRIKLSELDRINELTQFEYIELAGKIKPSLDKVVFDTRVDSVHAGLGLPRSYTGKNVIIGVNDWGFDYTSPMFYDTTLQETRILAAWDQFRNAGSSPAGYNYGSEFTTAAQLLAIQGDTSNQLGYGTHGTHVAGIAGGSGAGTQYKGMAFEANYLFTTILVDEAAAIDSWYWMYEKAQSYQKRLVVNMSWGLYHFGTCDGTSLLSQAIEELTDNGVLFVSSAGNNGSVNFHFERNFNNDSIKSRVVFYDYAYHDSLWGQSLHGWGEIGKNFEVKLQFKTGATFLGETDYYSTTLNGYDEGFLVFNNGNDTIWYNITAQEAHPQNLKPTVRFRVKNKQTSILVDLVVRAVEGKVHFWNLVELTTNGGNWGQPFNSAGAGYIAGNNQYGIGEPTSADDCISVASHSASYLHSNGVNVLGGTRSSFSSIGPRNDGFMKPEISAPGSNVLSSISSFTTDSYTSETSIEFNGRTYHFARFSGTSMSSPVVTGVCALLWEVNPYLTPRQVKEIIINTARQDNNTGVLPSTGDPRWGYGKLNAMAALKEVLLLVGLDEIEYNNTVWDVYPNPANNTFKINGLTDIETIQLIDATGRIVELDNTLAEWSTSIFESGVYTVRIIANKYVYQKKLLIL